MSGKLFALCYAVLLIIAPVINAQMNTVQQYSYSGNQTKLNGFNIIAVTDDSTNYAVYHYSNGYYTRWEAEDTTANLLGTGLKANFGSNTTYNNINCWTTGNDTSNSSRIVLYGPHYRQDKVYKLEYISDPFIEYELKFSLAGTDFIIPSDYSPGDPICKVSIVFSYKTGGVMDSIILAEKTIHADSIFSSFTPFALAYCYPDSFCAGLDRMSSFIEYKIFDYNDSEPLTGIQFQFTWYGKKQVYIDKFEVYDNIIGNEIVNFPELVSNKLNSFARNYTGGSNLKYINEPKTLDNYTPMRFVDSILRTSNHPAGIAGFNPQWNNRRDGDKAIKKFNEMANPRKILMEYKTFDANESIYTMFENQRQRLQEIYQADPDFWYEALIDSSGVYIYRLQSNDLVMPKKFILMK